MARVLVTGGTGMLGRALVPRLQRSGHTVRVLSRQPRPATLAEGLEWAQGDVTSGAGLADAVAGVQVIVNAVTSPQRQAQQVDVQGTERLLAQARAAGVAHFLHVSIVGIEQVPLALYRAKLASEAAVTASGVPYSILRATQFFSLMDGVFHQLARLPVMIVPTDFLIQPVDGDEVAERLAALVAEPPGGRLPDMGGPEALRVGDMVAQWLRARGKRRLVLPVWVPGRVAAAFRQGAQTGMPNPGGQLTWAAWLQQRYGRASRVGREMAA